MKAEDVEIGMVVKLVSDGPAMTVVEVKLSEELPPVVVGCLWFDVNGHTAAGYFLPVCLIKWPEPEEAE